MIGGLTLWSAELRRSMVDIPLWTTEPSQAIGNLQH